MFRWRSTPLRTLAGGRPEGDTILDDFDIVEKAGTVDLATTAAEIVLVLLLLLMVGSRTRRWILNALLTAGLVLWLSRFGVTWSFFIGELVGVVLIFLGFLVSIEVFSDLRLPFTRIVLRRRGRVEGGSA